VSVCGTGPYHINPSSFSWLSVLSPHLSFTSGLRLLTGLRSNLSLADLPTRHQQAPNAIAIERGKFQKASLLQCDSECWNINQLCIDYAFRPCLSSRLTLGRFSLPRKPWIYGGQDSHLSFCYSCQHSLFASLHHGSPHNFNAIRMLPYRIPN